MLPRNSPDCLNGAVASALGRLGRIECRSAVKNSRGLSAPMQIFVDSLVFPEPFPICTPGTRICGVVKCGNLHQHPNDCMCPVLGTHLRIRTQTLAHLKLKQLLSRRYVNDILRPHIRPDIRDKVVDLRNRMGFALRQRSTCFCNALQELVLNAMSASLITLQHLGSSPSSPRSA